MHRDTWYRNEGHLQGGIALSPIKQSLTSYDLATVTSRSSPLTDSCSITIPEGPVYYRHISYSKKTAAPPPHSADVSRAIPRPIKFAEAVASPGLERGPPTWKLQPVVHACRQRLLPVTPEEVRWYTSLPRPNMLAPGASPSCRQPPPAVYVHLSSYRV
ncbi:hypothetical protein BC834DRAFT_559459 [Gloeopeniophorella convolvens]|nr:hypothetical protein BC834DRAFT_559459 [Gloeopeniophorella convolvens]